MERVNPPSTVALPIGFYPKQLEALCTLSTDLLFGGASEGGKSVFIRLGTMIFCTLIPGLQVYIFRKYYKDVIANHMTGELNYHTLCRPMIENKAIQVTENQVRWPHTGSLITLGQLRTDEDFEKAQGIPKHMLIIDEATQCKKHHVAGLRGWVRMSNDMKDKLPQQLRPLIQKCQEIFATKWPGLYPPGYPNYTDEQLREFFPRTIQTANPIGQSVGYYRRQFVLAAPPGKIWQAPDEEGGFLRQFIPSRITDNPSADPEAQRRRLSGMGKKVADALIYGDWTAPGGDFYPEWDEELHVIDDFVPPKHWFKYRAFDTGYAEPFYCGWFAIADGEEFTDREGRVRWLPAGALVLYREWNGCDPEDPSKGLRMRNTDIATGILSRTPEITTGITLTDKLPFNDTGGGKQDKKRTIATEFEDAGVVLQRANTARKTGWSLLRDRLIGMQVSESAAIPMFYVMRSCQWAIEYIPSLTYHPTDIEDAQEKGEATHSLDVIRYASAAFPRVVKQQTTSQAMLLQEAEKNIMTFAGAKKRAQRIKSQRAKTTYGK